VERYGVTYSPFDVGLDPWVTSPGHLGGRPSLSAYKWVSRTPLLPCRIPSPWTASSASFPAHRRPYHLNRLPLVADRPLRALEHLHHAWPGMALERQPGHTWRRAASREASLARPGWSGKTAPAQRRRGSPHYHRLTAASCVRLEQLREACCALCPLARPAPLQPHALASLDHCRARTPAARHELKDERAEADHMDGHRCRFSCLECGPAARSCGPTHACQGVGRRNWKARAPDDGRRTCVTTLERGTRPALNLFWTPPAARVHLRPGAVWAPPGGSGRFLALKISTRTGAHA